MTGAKYSGKTPYGESITPVRRSCSHKRELNEEEDRKAARTKLSLAAQGREEDGMKKIVQKAIIKVIQRQKVEFYCDTCGEKLSGVKRKVTYFQQGELKDKHACYDKPCCPFSEPKGYHKEWNPKGQYYEWRKDKND